MSGLIFHFWAFFSTIFHLNGVGVEAPQDAESMRLGERVEERDPQVTPPLRRIFSEITPPSSENSGARKKCVGQTFKIGMNGAKWCKIISMGRMKESPIWPKDCKIVWDKWRL
jgi:hypothetical protein